MSDKKLKGQNTDDENTKGLSMSLPHNFSHQIYPSDLPVLFMVNMFYQSNLLVLFVVRKNYNTKKVLLILLTMEISGKFSR